MSSLAQIWPREGAEKQLSIAIMLWVGGRGWCGRPTPILLLLQLELELCKSLWISTEILYNLGPSKRPNNSLQMITRSGQIYGLLTLHITLSHCHTVTCQEFIRIANATLCSQLVYYITLISLIITFRQIGPGCPVWVWLEYCGVGCLVRNLNWLLIMNILVWSVSLSPVSS